MQRIPCDERPDWREKAEAIGFQFHTIDGERYWDERAYYAFTLEEIERDMAARRSEPLWPLRFELRRAGTREAARIQCRYADLGVRDRGVSMVMAGGCQGAPDHTA